MGDAIAQTDLDYGIVEFKRDFNSIPTEAEKYEGDGDYRHWRHHVVDNSLRKAIPEGGEPHSLVYGLLVRDNNWLIIDTRTTPYWWPRREDQLEQPIRCHSGLFSVYLKNLADYRNTKPISGSAGGSIFGFDGSGVPVVHIDLEVALRTYRADYDFPNEPVAGPILGSPNDIT